MSYRQISIDLDILKSEHAHLACNKWNFKLFEKKCYKLQMH